MTRILLVDDNPDDRTLVMRELRREFPDAVFEEITAADAFARSVQGASFDLVITDYQLRWSDGLAVLRAVKGRWPDCPVIMFTGTGNELVAVEAMRNGLDDYVLKGPKRYVRLSAAARTALDRAGQRRALEAAEARYASLFDTAPIGLIRTTPEGRWVQVNPAAVRMLGYADAGTLMSRPRMDIYVDPEDRERWREILRREGRVQGVETRLRRLDGTPIWGRLTVAPVRDAAGEVIYHDAAIEDITERKVAEEQIEQQRQAMAQSDKLATMGQLLAGVAHELNNPLSVVVGQAALMQMGALDATLQDRLARLQTAADRCARIVKSFLALARQRAPERTRVSLNRVVDEVLELVAYALKVDGAEVRLSLAPDLPTLFADADQLHQVVVNLLTNAHQAMRGSGLPRRLTIASRFDAARRRAVLEVADTGPGIAIEIQPRIFEPFFTTKEPGQGTGLGLSLCAAIVHDHGGDIHVESRPGHGAVFRIELPAEAGAQAPLAPRSSEAPAEMRARNILVVDDEPEVAELVGEILSRADHYVQLATDGARALEALAERRYDLVLTDMRMPGMDGPRLYGAIIERYPHLSGRIVFLTGDLLSDEIREFLESVRAPSVSKPFNFAELVRVVHAVFAST